MKKTTLSFFVFIVAANSWSVFASTPWEVGFGFNRYIERIEDYYDATIGLPLAKWATH